MVPATRPFGVVDHRDAYLVSGEDWKRSWRLRLNSERPKLAKAYLSRSTDFTLGFGQLYLTLASRHISLRVFLSEPHHRDSLLSRADIHSQVFRSELHHREWHITFIYDIEVDPGRSVDHAITLTRSRYHNIQRNKVAYPPMTLKLRNVRFTSTYIIIVHSTSPSFSCSLTLPP